jgi:hypothetical protein
MLRVRPFPACLIYSSFRLSARPMSTQSISSQLLVLAHLELPFLARLDIYFAATFQGQFQVKSAGTYTFCTSSDDGSDLIVDGAVVVNNQGLHSTTQVCESIQLDAGLHKAFVNFFQNDGETSCMVTWSGPDTGGAAQSLRCTGNPNDAGTTFKNNLCTVTWPSNFVASTKALATCQAIVNQLCIAPCADGGLIDRDMVSPPVESIAAIVFSYDFLFPPPRIYAFTLCPTLALWHAPAVFLQTQCPCSSNKHHTVLCFALHL